MGTSDLIEGLPPALAGVTDDDLAALSDAALTEQIDHLVTAIRQLDAHLGRLANAVLERSFVVSDVVPA